MRNLKLNIERNFVWSKHFTDDSPRQDTVDNSRIKPSPLRMSEPVSWLEVKVSDKLNLPLLRNSSIEVENWQMKKYVGSSFMNSPEYKNIN